MDPQRPRRLDVYCQQFGTSFFDVRLPCLFCKFELDLQELADFHQKALCLIWKGDKCYAACRRCLRLSALHERENCCRCSVPPDAIEHVTGKSLKDLVLRCYLCYKQLDYAEKIDCVAADVDILLIRHHWRALCRNCTQK